MSTSLELLALQRQALQVQRQFESLQREYNERKSQGTSSFDINYFRNTLLQIKQETEREFTEKDNQISHFKNVINITMDKVKQLRTSIVTESKQHSDKIFRAHIATELRKIRSDVVQYEMLKKKTIFELQQIRTAIEKENTIRIQQKEEINNLNNIINEKQNIIDNVFNQARNIKNQMIKESGQVYPDLFKNYIREELTKLRNQVENLVRENNRIKNGNNGYIVEETKEEKIDNDDDNDDNLIPPNPPNKVPSSKRIESSDRNIPTQLDIDYYTCYICPWSHRVWLTLLYKAIPFDLKYLELDNKPKWFTEDYLKADNCNKSSTGQVPLIRHNDFYLCESGPLVDYLDSISSNNLLKRKNQRLNLYIDIVTSWASEWIPKLFYGILRCASETTRKELGEEYIKKCGELNNKLNNDMCNGPFLCGNTPSKFEMYFIPFFDRMPIIQMFYGNNRSFIFNDIFKNNKRFTNWYNACMKLNCVIKSHNDIKNKYNMQPLDYYKSQYTGYIPKNVKVN